MRKTITGTGGMLLLQTLKDAGVEYLFTNPGSAETGLFAAIAEDGDNRLVVGKHEGLVAAMADGYHRVSGKVGVVIAHVMGGSHQLAGQLFNAQVAGSSLLVVAGDWASELQDYRGLAPFPGLSQAESMRPITKEARCAYQVHTNPAAISVATIRALREATTPPTGPVYLSISAELLHREGLEAQIGEDAHYRIERPGPARAQTVEAIARRLGEAQCPVLMFGDDVWREGAQAEAVRLAELLEAPVFASRQIFPNFPTRHPLYCGNYPVSKDFEKTTGLTPDLIFLVGCQGVHGSVNEPYVIQIGPNPLLMGRHYPLDIAAQCELPDTLRSITEALARVHASDRRRRVGPPAREGARLRQAPDRSRRKPGAGARARPGRAPGRARGAARERAAAEHGHGAGELDGADDPAAVRASGDGLDAQRRGLARLRRGRGHRRQDRRRPRAAGGAAPG